MTAIYHGIPFYFAAPNSTFDLTEQANNVSIKERDRSEIVEIREKRIAPKGMKVFNPAFDVTPLKLVSGVITEREVFPQIKFETWHSTKLHLS